MINKFEIKIKNILNLNQSLQRVKGTSRNDLWTTSTFLLV